MEELVAKEATVKVSENQNHSSLSPCKKDTASAKKKRKGRKRQKRKITHGDAGRSGLLSFTLGKPGAGTDHGQTSSAYRMQRCSTLPDSHSSAEDKKTHKRCIAYTSNVDVYDMFWGLKLTQSAHSNA